jgi:hypothetical protein
LRLFCCPILHAVRRDHDPSQVAAKRIAVAAEKQRKAPQSGLVDGHCYAFAIPATNKE